MKATFRLFVAVVAFSSPFGGSPAAGAEGGHPHSRTKPADAAAPYVLARKRANPLPPRGEEKEPPTTLANWAVVVVAGDDQSAHEDLSTEAFDNARRDVASAFVARGVSPSNVAQFSLHPDRYPADRPLLTAPRPIFTRLTRLAKAAPDGCLVYFTSHGSPDGVVVGDDEITPAQMTSAVDFACGERPTAVIISACYSGVFVPALRGPDRFVLTAARRDRSSFGCGESDKYPFFDGCVIEHLPASIDFADLARRVLLCVDAREDAEGMRPRSQPQVFVGPRFAKLGLRFN